MKCNARLMVGLALLALLASLNRQHSSCLAQGTLTPPGAPGPTMKTLVQVEPRTPISSAPFTISKAGSYYLTTNLTVSTGNAITIVAGGVTLDLGGFTISSTAPSATGFGILLTNAASDIIIFNGHIRGGVTNKAGIYDGPGFASGVASYGAAPGNKRASGVTVSGCLVYGILFSRGESTLVESCTVQTVGDTGITASTIKTSLAVECGKIGIYGDQVLDSRGEGTGNGGGINAFVAMNCYGSTVSGTGIYTTTAQNCYGSSSTGRGVYALATAQNCYGSSTSGTGLEAGDAAQNCYGYTTSGTAGLVAKNASFCVGGRPNGRAIDATVATGCWATAGTNRITHKYNMP